MTLVAADIIVKIALISAVVSFISALIGVVLSLVVPLGRRKPYLILAGAMIGIFVVALVAMFVVLNWSYAQVGDTVTE